MQIDVSYFQNIGTEDKKDWVKITKTFFDFDECVKFLNNHDRYRYEINIKRFVK